MSTKNSQKTEDMLDQTFANFDTQVTGMDAQTGEGTGAAQGGKTPAGGAKKKSSNTVIFIAAGVAAIAVVGYLFVVKPMITESAYTPPVAAQQNNEAKLEAPESAPPVAADQTQVPDLPDANANAAAVPQVPDLPDANANAAVPQVQDLPDFNAVPQIPALPEANAAPQVPVLPEANVPVPQMPAIPDLTNAEPNKTVSVANATSVAAVEELKSLFDAQTTEFRNILGDVEMKITGIESNIQKQNEFNLQVEERLTALESGKKTVAAPAKKEDGAEKPVVVKKIVKQPKRKKVVKAENSVKHSDSEILVDKSSANSAKKEAKSSLPEVNVYSVYGGRVWIKNADGSLSTYASGDEIAPGEKIKKINDETFEVVTNKRTIRQ